ncbi:MAG: acyl-CoA dehydrogenase family protein, partial [Tidjanibacter sp.]|nr:acyl-CoA dehydrogenase family protein [Tidjanibacter sp.]
MNNFYKDNEALKKQLQHPLMERIAEMCEKGYTNEDGSEYAPKDYNDLQDSYDKTLEILGEISAEVIAANAAGVDLEGPHCADGRVTYASGTQQNHETLIEAGLYGMTMPRRYGGLNFPTTLFVMASEIVARADAGFCNIWSLQSCADTINEFADEELKEEFLPLIAEGATCSMDLTEPDSGSDLQSATLRATWNEELGEWRLNGVKRFITNGDADVKLILARSEEGTTDGRGLSYFVYNKKWGGITVRRIEHKMGIKGSPTCELVFKDAPAKLIGRRRMGLIKYVMA